MEPIVYHEIAANSLEQVLKNGIKRTEQGGKSKQHAIQKTDNFLDTHRTPAMVTANISRSGTIYGYMVTDDQVVNITTGQQVSIPTLKANRSKQLVKVTIDPTRCYVSDLDLYDTLKRALELDEQDSTREHLAEQYWIKITRLSDYKPGTIKRPEIMITYDVPPTAIEPLD
jgi:hypothetical protein